MKLKNLASLMTLFRYNSKGGQVSSLAVECFLHVAEAPRTIAELCTLTGAKTAHVNRAVRSYTPCLDGEVLITPDMHLLTRKKRAQPLRGYTIHLSKGGKQFLKQAGIS